jgi:DNA integrity scanning protein DisA with diadenylate cyclase activity
MDGELEEALSDALVRMAKAPACEKVLLIGVDVDDRLNAQKKKLIVATSLPSRAALAEADGIQSVMLPAFTARRHDRLKAALVGALSLGVIEENTHVLVALSRDEGGAVDTLMVISPTGEEPEHASLVDFAVASGLDAQLLEIVIDLAVRIGREGYEGRAIGTMLVVGDATSVMERSRPLTLNPFQGYSEAERNLFATEVVDAVRTFAMLDGAFIVRDDGVVMAAGRHIETGDHPPDVPLGLGARHVAAAAISRDTKAVAIAVSQSSGCAPRSSGRRPNASRRAPRPRTRVARRARSPSD